MGQKVETVNLQEEASPQNYMDSKGAAGRFLIVL